MVQNIYDSQPFFDSYATLPRSQQGLLGAAEWPTMRQLVGNVTNKHVIDLGCGYGWFCRYAAEEGGAATVVGVDVSEKMLAKAKSFGPQPNIEYKCGDLETLSLQAGKYDLVYSSLTLHYLPDLSGVMRQIAAALTGGGRFVFSVEHPTMTAPSDATWKKDGTGKPYWPLNDYGKEGLRVTRWLGSGEEVHKYHHRLETYLSAVMEAGMSLEAVRESWDGLDMSCSNYEESGHRPYFLLVKARKSEVVQNS